MIDISTLVIITYVRDFSLLFSIRTLTLLSFRERRRFEWQPSHTTVRGANDVVSSPELFLYVTPLTTPFSSIKDLTVPSSSRTLPIN